MFASILIKPFHKSHQTYMYAQWRFRSTLESTSLIRLFAVYLKYLRVIGWAYNTSIDLDQNMRMLRLIWGLAQRTCNCVGFLCTRRWYIDKLGILLYEPSLYSSLLTSEIRVKLVASNMFKLASNLFLLPFQGGASFLYIFFYLYFVFVCQTALSVLCNRVVSCWERAYLLALLHVMFNCVFVTFPFGVLGQVWYLIASISDICLLPNFVQACCNTTS